MTYDGLGRLESESVNNGIDTQTYAYAYDDANNRTSLTATGEDAYTTAYTYDENNRLLTETKATAESADTTTYFYDPNGNQIAKTSESVNEGTGSESLNLEEGVACSVISRYNGFDQLTGATIDDVEISYTYFPSGLRASKTVDSVTTDYVLDGDQVVLELAGGSVTAVYVRGMNLVYSVIGSTSSYYLYNGHGDVVQLADALGSVTQEYGYDAFGNEKDPDSEDTNPFRYCGEYFDISSGTYYLRARYYDPTIGRFLAEDTHWNPSNMIYGDNPVKWNERESDPNDPLGLNTYTYIPDVLPLRRAEPYVYCITIQFGYVDPTGN